MPITKSAKKAVRQNEKKRKLNNWHKKRIKKTIKQINDFIIEKKMEEAKKLLPLIYKEIDKAAKKGLIKKNTAARKKSKIAQAIVKETN